MSRKYLETIKAVDAQVQNLEYHQQRLQSVLDSLSCSSYYSLKEHLKPPKNGTYKCRVVYDENDINITYSPYTKRNVQTLKLLYSDDIEYTKKYEDRELINTLFKLRDTCDDILIVKSGLITDTSIANVAFYDAQQWYTPKRPLLQGTARQRFLESGKIIAKDIFVEDIKNFQKVALMNAMIDFDIIAQENIGDVIC